MTNTKITEQYQYLMDVPILLWWQVAELSYDSFMNRLKAR